MSNTFRSRVKELRLVPARDILGAPWNWRLHPQSQLDLIQSSVQELGLVDPLDVFEVANGQVQLFDGHARLSLIASQIGPDTLVPCNVTDLTEQEARLATLVKDPIARMASNDAAALRSLAEATTDKEEAVETLLTQLSTPPAPPQGLNQTPDPTQPVNAANSVPDDASTAAPAAPYVKQVICPYCAHEFVAAIRV